MSRNFVLAIGALLWTVYALVAIFHALAGDWVGPVVASVVVTAAVVLRHTWRRLPKAF